jgi:cysteine desulfurase/selenocysteine lyase
MLSVRNQFPILNHQPDLVYLDSAATALKPERVIFAEKEYYTDYSANIHRGVYRISERAAEEYEKAREEIAKFIGVGKAKEVIFVRNATEAINLVAYSWGRVFLDKGDEIALTVMEHHANMVPWQQLGQEVGATLRYLDITEDGKLEVGGSNLEKWITKKTKLVAITQASNVLGTINDVKEIVKRVREINPKVVVLVDGAQAVPRMKVKVSEIGCDFYALTGHKMYGPTGIGALWGREEILGAMPPFECGGGMIKSVNLDGADFLEIPEKFEAGTPNIAGAIGMGEAARFLAELGMENVREHEVGMNKYAMGVIRDIGGIRVFGPSRPEERTGIMAFTVKGVHPHDLSQLLDEDNIAVRAGHHCAMPLHTRLRVTATTRASFGVYTTKEDIDQLAEGIERAKRKLGV